MRIQFTTDLDACEADGWQRLGPANDGEEEFRDPVFDSVSPGFRAEGSPTSGRSHDVPVIGPTAAASSSGSTAPVDTYPSAQSSSSEFANNLAIVPYEGGALDLVASRASRVGRLDWAPVNEYPRKIVKEEPEGLRAGAKKQLATISPADV